MMLPSHVNDIKQSLRAGRFTNEASVSHGVVLRLLQALGWPTYDIQVIKPEFSLEGRRVDFALCHPADKPLIFVEVKQVGKSDGGEKQLFEYAFFMGVPMAILTDGQEWHFYLPGEKGLYQDRRFYKLDLLERSTDEVVARLQRYLDYGATRTGTTIEAARADLANVAISREIKSTIPAAWDRLVEERDELLIELLVDKVESMCGFKPTIEQASDFLASMQRKGIPAAISKAKGPGAIKPSSGVPSAQPHVQANFQMPGVGFIYKGTFYPAKSAKDAMIGLLKLLHDSDDTFLVRFAARPKHGRSRRFVAKSKSELYPTSPHLAELSEELAPGWWVSTNWSKQAISQIVAMACEVAQLKFESEVIINLG